MPLVFQVHAYGCHVLRVLDHAQAVFTAVDEPRALVVRVLLMLLLQHHLLELVFGELLFPLAFLGRRPVSGAGCTRCVHACSFLEEVRLFDLPLDLAELGLLLG